MPSRHEEGEIGTGNKLDFASLLDDLIIASEKGEDAGAQPSIPFDYLSVADELHSGRIKVAGESVAAEYREAGADLAAEFAALLDQAKLTLAGLDRPGKNADYGRMRRSFAFANHPDRVAPHLRQRAMIRMQVANMLIDEAKRRALAGARR